MTASEDKLRQRAVRVPGAAGCGLPSSPLPPCPPSARLPLFSPSPSSSPLLPASLYLIDVGFRCCFSPWRYLFGFLLDPLATGTKGEEGLPMVQHLPLQPGERRGGKRGALRPRLPAPAGRLFSHFARNAFELLPDPIVCRANGVQRPAVIRCGVCKRRKEWSCIPTPKEHLKSAVCHDDNLSAGPCFSLPSSAHRLPYLPLIVPGISGSDMEAFQTGAARQDSFWGEEGCAFGLFMWDCALPTTHL